MSDYDVEEDYGQEDGHGNGGGDEGGNDLTNYKGIYYGDDPGQKYTDPETGAHFEFVDMCRRLARILQKR